MEVGEDGSIQLVPEKPAQAGTSTFQWERKGRRERRGKEERLGF